MQKFKQINWIFIISLLIWVVVTLIRTLNHFPWYDEAHAWTISQELNLFEIFKFMKYEGHLFVWYLLLMPFAKTNFLYPYSMLILNWFFCFVAILILWLKSPFNNWVKFFISFSFPFLALFPVIARCYSIGILILFVLISVDKVKLKHPCLYSFLLVICANTSLMGAIPAFVLGIIFACEMVKNKQNIHVPFIIAILGAVIVLLQLFGCVESGLSFYNGKNDLISLLSDVMRYNSFYYWLGIYILSFILSLVFYIKNKVVPYFFIFSSLFAIALFCVYAGRLWHLFFVLLYFVISCWLLLEKSLLKWKNLLNISLGIIFLSLIFYKPVVDDYKTLWKDNRKKVVKEILTNDELKTSTILLIRQFDTSMQPFLKNTGVNLVNYCSNELLNYDTRSFLQSKNCLLDMNIDSELINLDNEVFDKWYSDKLYILTLGNIRITDLNAVSDKINYKFILYKDLGQNKLWKVEKFR